jgi:hypothetical protein
MSFFGMSLAQTWLAMTQYYPKDAIFVENDKRNSQFRASLSHPGLGTGRPYTFLICAPKIGMNQRVLSRSGCNSSRFSGPCTRSYVKSIPKKRHPYPLFHVQFLRRKEVKGRNELRVKRINVLLCKPILLKKD